MTAELKSFPDFQVGGYILAGGRSSRMGAEKSLLPLAGRPLIEHALAKLRPVCSDVHILSSNTALAAYAPLLPDLHPGCGPLGGMEAALTHSFHPWNLFLAVDMPFIPTAFILHWMRLWAGANDRSCRIRIFLADGRPQPGLCLVHKDALPSFSASIHRGELKLMHAFTSAAAELAAHHGLRPDSVLWTHPIQSEDARPLDPATVQHSTEPLWFTNLNTPEEFAAAEANSAALDP